MENEKKKYLISLNHFSKFGPIKLKILKKYFNNWENAFKANLLDLMRAGINKDEACEFLSKRIKINPDKIMESLGRENIKTISIEENKYPKLLSQIYDPPPLIYFKGDISFQDKLSLAIVGSRNCSYYGKQIIKSIIPDLIKNKITIISGLAIGIDCLAQEKTIEERGKTIGVLGSGIDNKSIYPKQNIFLAEKIISRSGAIISEFPPGTEPAKKNFPQRNRIISGLSKGTLIIEAELRSGSLITARCALEQGREVMAVPGSIHSSFSNGTNNLIKEGARPITEAGDILEALDIEEAVQETLKFDKT